MAMHSEHFFQIPSGTPFLSEVEIFGSNFFKLLLSIQTNDLPKDGVLSIKFSNGCILEIANIEESTFGNDRVVEIFSNSGLYKINDSKGELVGPDSLKKNTPFFRQSELTSRYLGDIQNGVCKLPTLSQCLIDFKSILPVVENSVLFLLKQKGLLLEL